MADHEKYIARCLELANAGLGYVAPNPLVGSVIVHNNKIIGEGYHIKHGGPHAEVNAINAVEDHSLLQHSILFVNLEPCSHEGKTPPCASLIIKKKIGQVVIGCKDPYEKVNGKGVKMLEEAGVKVTTGILENDCAAINKRFFTFIQKKRPYVILKWAQTTDGYMAPTDKGKYWITNDQSKQLVHKWRSEEDAIIVGTNTAELDDPQLSVREWHGNNPTRIVIDKSLRLPVKLKLFDEKIPTIVFTQEQKPNQPNVTYISIDFEKSILPQIFEVLHEKEIQSIMVEGGLQLLSSFLEKKCWDEARVFTANKEYRDGIKAPVIQSEPVSTENINGDLLNIFHNSF